jgi:hypothetical protein
MSIPVYGPPSSPPNHGDDGAARERSAPLGSTCDPEGHASHDQQEANSQDARPGPQAMAINSHGRTLQWRGSSPIGESCNVVGCRPPERRSA